MNQGYRKKGRNVNAKSRETDLKAILSFEFQDKIDKTSKELWNLKLYHIFNVNKVTSNENWIELWINEWLLIIIINKLFNGLELKM